MIEEGMLLPRLSTLEEYAQWLQRQGFKIIETQDISRESSKTWDICLDLIASPSLWRLAITHGKDFLHFLRAFQSMRAGFSSKTFIFGIIVAEKVRNLEGEGQDKQSGGYQKMSAKL